MTLNDLGLADWFPLKTGKTKLYVGQFITDYGIVHEAHYPEEVLHYKRFRSVKFTSPGEAQTFYMFWVAKPHTTDSRNDMAQKLLEDALEVKSHRLRGHRKSAVRGWAFRGHPIDS